MWLYQMSQRDWSPNNYRLDVWEGERWEWPVGRMVGADDPPGDVVVFFYAPAGGAEPGFYGWAVVQQWIEEPRRFYFRPVAPSDQLKMHPWWDADAKRIADQVRGGVKQGTLWPVPDNLAPAIAGGITKWVGGQSRERGPGSSAGVAPGEA
jgi:hypothetical protein